MTLGTLRAGQCGSYRKSGVSFTATVPMPNKKNRHIHTGAMLNNKDLMVIYLSGIQGSQKGERQTTKAWSNENHNYPQYQSTDVESIMHKPKHLIAMQTD